VNRPILTDLVIGFSFGILPTGAPGRLNERIATRIAEDSGVRSNDCLVGMQWELEDALRRINLHHRSDCVVAPSPALTEDDIICLRDLESAVESEEHLKKAFEELNLHRSLKDVFQFKNRAVAYCNRLLSDKRLFRSFDRLQLKPLRKSKSGRDWEESRVIPPAKSPDLNTFQNQRVNRLIIETIAEKAIKQAKYLGTIDVAQAVWNVVRDRNLTVAHVRVYGHPEHVLRGRIQTLESAWKLGLQLDPAQVTVIPCGDSEREAPGNWDPDNAQEWIRTWELYRQHEGI
jgi:hypothetical protein